MGNIPSTAARRYLQNADQYIRSKRSRNRKFEELDDKQLIVWDIVNSFFEANGPDKTFRSRDVLWKVKKRIVNTIRQRLGVEWGGVNASYMEHTLLRVGGFTLGNIDGEVCISGTLILAQPTDIVRKKQYRWR